MSSSGARTRRSDVAWSVGAAGPLLRLVADNDYGRTTWRDFALCKETDPEQWFPEKGQSTAAAKRVCAVCPSLLPCREYGVETDQKFGVWGGLSERDRRRIKRERREQAA